MKKKLLCLVLCLMMVLAMLPAIASAEGDPEAEQENTIGVYANRSNYGAVPAEIPGSRAISDAYMRGDMDTYYRLSAENSKRGTLPSQYDSRNYHYVTAVRNQGSYGTCWAHAAMACVESYMIKHGIPVGTGSAATTNLNLSETQHGYFTFSDTYDAEGMLTGDTFEPTWDDWANNGGNGALSALTLQRWTGAADESVSALKYSNIGSVVDNGLGSRYAYRYDVCHVQNSVWIPASNIDAVKRAIMEFGAGDINYYESGAAYTYTCTIDSSQSMNHVITVIGWDDSIATSKFRPNKPSKPGAWICKNSWGTGSFDGGYCYISYEDTTVLDNLIYFYAAEPVDNYDHNYQYDGTCNIGSYAALDNGSRVANVFTAKRNEVLRAVAFCTFDEAVSYQVEIYKNPASVR